MIVLGVDPGITGALCLLRDRDVLRIEDMPACVKPGNGAKVRRQIDAVALAAVLRGVTMGLRDECVVAVERVAAMPSMDATTVFSLGDSAGVIRGVVAALGMTLVYVEPRVWKRRFNLDCSKGASRVRASEHLPDAAHHWARAKDHNRAEAALIARFAWEERA